MLREFLKVTWMAFWRLFLLMLIFGMQSAGIIALVLGIVTAIVVVGLLKSGVKVFPLFRLIFRGQVIYDLDRPKPRSGYSTPRSQPTGYGKPYSTPPASSPAPSGPIQEKAVGNGGDTEFTPYKLGNVTVPLNAPRFFGVPGSGLSSSHFSETNQKLGSKGETLFAKSLAKAGLLNNVDSFWSVSMPDQTGMLLPDQKMKTDIDAVIVSGRSIFLIDLKYYKSGDVTYTARGQDLYCHDNQTGNQIGEPKKMTRNMEMAVDRFRKALPSHQIYAFVVFMPTDKGSPRISNVEWPGRVPAVTIDQMVQYLHSNSAANNAVDTNLRTKLQTLVK